MTKQIGGAFIGTLAAGALIVASARVLGPFPLTISQTTTNKASAFDVSGEGEVTSTPDRAEINVGVQTNETTVQRAQEKGNSVILTITKELQALGIEKDDIKTINYSLYPNYDYQPGSGQRITGYALNVNLMITAKDFTKINQIVDTATKSGANQIGGISFTLSDEKRRELEDQVREIAIKRAKEKAESLSSIAGVKLGKIINVQENTGSSPLLTKDLMSARVSNEAMGAGGGSPTNVEPGSTTYRMSVTLSYETL